MFSNAFNNLAPRRVTESIDKFDLDDDPLKFASLLDAIYKGTSHRSKGPRFIMHVIELAQKYRMTEIETYFQDLLVDKLPSSVDTLLSMDDPFDLYRENSWLALSVLEHGRPALRPWALYSLGVQFTSDLDPSDPSTYTIPSCGTDNAYNYYRVLPTVQRIIPQSLLDWNSRLEKFFQRPCNGKAATALAARSTRGSDKCTRPNWRFNLSSRIYIRPGEECKDPLWDILPRIQKLKERQSMHGDGFCTWCMCCMDTVRLVAEDVVVELHSRLIKCVELLDQESTDISK
ncbi:hypothetical protein FRC08_002585 [Ceratobasidium sp. 394]|nr:hypothetical protein FRC08_002585 [Ceratobasidium sp. 394]